MTSEVTLSRAGARSRCGSSSLVRRVVLLLLATACGNEVRVTFTAPAGTQLTSLRVGIKQADVSLFDGPLAADGGVIELPASLKVLVAGEKPLTVHAEAVDVGDRTRARSVTSGALSRTNELEIDLSEAVVCPAPPARSNEVVLFDDESHDRDEFTYFSGAPRRSSQACSGTASSELVTNNASDGIGLYVGRQVPAGLRYRRLSLRLWASRVGTVQIGLVGDGGAVSDYHWLPTVGSVHELSPEWKSFTFDVPETIPNTIAIHVRLNGLATPATVRLDDVRVVPR